MHDRLNNPPPDVMLRARREIRVLSLIKDEPMTLKQISAAMDVNPRTVKSIVYDLKIAGVVHRLPGTLLVCIDSNNARDQP